MGIKALDITEDFFSSFQTTSAKLSILLGMDSFCYAIIDHHNRLAFVRRITGLAPLFELAHFNVLEQENPYLFFPFAGITIALATPQHTLVPDALYQDSATALYFEHGNVRAAHSLIRTEYLPDHRMHLVYSLPKATDIWLRMHFPSATVRHLHTVLYRGLQTHLPVSGVFLVGHIWEEGLVVLLWNQGSLVFENRFDCQSAKDYLYYLLLVCSQLYLDAGSITLWLSGGITMHAEIYQLLHKYFFRIEFLDLGVEVAKGPQAQGYPAHYFNDLIANSGLA